MDETRTELPCDIEELERLRRSEARLLDITSAAAEFFWEIDADGRFTFLTQPVEALFGKPVERLLGKNLIDFIADDEVLRVVAWFEDLGASTASDHDLEVRVLPVQGRTSWLRLAGRPFHREDGNLDGYRGTGRDITERKQSELEREVLRRRLDRALRATRDGLFEWPDLTRDEICLAPSLASDFGLRVRQCHHVSTVLAAIERADRPRLRAALRTHLDRGEPFDVEFRTAKGARVFVVRGEASREPCGTLSLVGTVRDVTLQRRESQLLRMAVQAAKQGFFEVDPRSDRCVFDRMWFAKLGYAPDQVPNLFESWQALIHVEDRERTDAGIRACAEGEVESFDAEYRVRQQDGSWRWVRTVAECVRDATTREVVRVIGLHQDVDARRRAVEELAAAKRAAELASLAKSEFLANMSHEIRTPMTAILGFADLAFDEDSSAEERRERLETVRRNGQHLLAILGDILDLSKIEAGKLELERVTVDIKALLEEIRTSMAIRAEGKGIDCKLVIASDVPELISSDPMRLRQILLNLVGNAVKFTNHGSVTLEASVRSALVTDASRIDLVLRVSDTGCGMEPEQLAKVFQPFMQADTSTTREYGGSGLGLTICRRLVELLGGRIEACSQAGSGSEFVVTLPITRAAPTSAPRIDDGRRLAELAANSDHRGLEGLEFLLAEDGEDNRRLLSHFLRRAGAIVTLAHDGQEAYDRILEHGETYDLIIMDMQMPRMDGYVATSSLRAAGITTPILALTAHAMRGDAERCLAAGCDAYATKPIGAKKLTALCHGLWLQHGADQASIKNRVS